MRLQFRVSGLGRIDRDLPVVGCHWWIGILVRRLVVRLAIDLRYILLSEVILLVGWLRDCWLAVSAASRRVLLLVAPPNVFIHKLRRNKDLK